MTVDPRVVAQEAVDRTEFRSYVERIEHEANVVERLQPNIFGRNKEQLMAISQGQVVNEGVHWRLSSFHQLKNMYEIMTKNLNDALGEDPKVSYGRKLREKVDFILEHYDDYHCNYHFVDLKEQIFGLAKDKDSDISQDQLIKLLHSMWIVLELTATILVKLPVKPRVAYANRPAPKFQQSDKVSKPKAKVNVEAKVKPTTSKVEVHKDRVMVQEGGQTVFRKVKPSTSEAPANKDLYKTKMCHYMQTKGHCTRGNSCTFAHDESELRLVPDNIVITDDSNDEPVTVVSVASSNSAPSSPAVAPAVASTPVVEVKAAPTMAAVVAASVPQATQANNVRQPIPAATPQPAVQFITAAAKQAASAKQ